MQCTITELNVYPIKSCAGIALESASVGRRGISLDREWMVVDHLGRFLSQREYPRMALIRPVLEDKLRIEGEGMPSISLPLDTEAPPGNLLEVTVWKVRCLAVDQGKTASEWFSTFLSAKVKLVRMPRDFVRRVDPAYNPSGLGQVGFADGFPFLLISQASLDHLNGKLDLALPMNRFRPNIVVGGCPAFAEDQWQSITSGGITFDVVKPCARCPITTIDQLTAQRGKEPLKTLATFRRQVGKVMFGQNLIHRQPGTLKIGDPLTVTERR